MNGKKFAAPPNPERALTSQKIERPMKAVRKIITTIQKIVHRIAQWPSKTIHLIYSIDMIKRKANNDRLSSIKAHSHNLPALENEETLLAHALKDHGFCTTNSNLFEFFGAERFQAASRDIYELMERNYLETGRNIDITRLLSAKPALIDQFETVFRAGLDIKLLRIVEHYLQLPVAYGGVDIFFTVADGLERGARTWHKDSEDNPMVKVAVYLNDVGDDDGPLEILHLHQTSSDFEKLRGFKQQKLVNLQNEGKVKFEITSFTGPVGTVILCDTFKFYHRGKPATGKNRRALFFNYYANRPLTPYFCPNPPFSLDKMKDLVSNLSTIQQDAALWRENLTRVDKMVTKRKPYLNL
ncbi:hypothetical protein [Methylobacterium sp. J-077]|uniref:hypothetical protein n=1 Tax=Methylobacterium sp. J-077 TaxID=2836656 RepID=UPI001FB92409|nr:hypothetical protein [Methylobacterium sp. J-077]MCJ2121769.1 hypothetical protein [Methylobacterium sp. J-077]